MGLSLKWWGSLLGVVLLLVILTEGDDKEKEEIGREVGEQGIEWPPKRPNGQFYTLDQAGHDLWVQDYNRAKKQAAAYKAALQKELSRSGFSAGQKLHIARPYSFCVDGYKPRWDNVKKKWLTAKESGENDKEPALERFLESKIFKDSQPPDGQPFVAHLKNGGSLDLKTGKAGLINNIIFSNVMRNKNYNRLNYEGNRQYWNKAVPLHTLFPDWKRGQQYTFGHLRFTYHIWVNATEELEGLYIQAIGFPMGLPFGKFHNDYECDFGPDWRTGDDGFSNPDADKTSSTNYKTLVKEFVTKGRRRNNQGSPNKMIHVPCKFSHGSNFGDFHPTVFAYGGHADAELEFPPRKTFRTYLTWSSTHCNQKFRLQFLIIAVQSFEFANYQVYLTPNYKLYPHSQDGVPTPYIEDWDVQEYKFMCAEDVVTNEIESDIVTSEMYESQLRDNKDNQVNTYIRMPRFNLMYTETSSLAILNDGDYDNCITESGGVGEDGVCPPKRICLNSEHVYENNAVTYVYDYPQGQYRKEWFATGTLNYLYVDPTNHDYFLNTTGCALKQCMDPDDYLPKLVVDGNRKNPNGDLFSPRFMQEFYSNVSQHFRRSKGTHGWTMIFAWFVLMSVGVFIGRFYKETAGIRYDLKNGCLGIGFWFWIHVILLFFATAFMWIGFTEIYHLRQSRNPCNALAKYSTTMKMTCRFRREIIRLHRMLGLLSVLYFHLSIVMAWTRPLVTYHFQKLRFRINYRIIFIYSHAILGYIGKFACLLSVCVFFLPKAFEVCKDLPKEVLIFEFVTIIFFLIASVTQIFESKQRRNRIQSVFPIQEANEAVDPAEYRGWYFGKITLGLIASFVHLMLMFLVLVSIERIYRQAGTNSTKQGAYETRKGLFDSCQSVSLAAESRVYMDRFYYGDTGESKEGQKLQDI